MLTGREETIMGEQADASDAPTFNSWEDKHHDASRIVAEAAEYALGKDHWTCGDCGYEGDGPDNVEWYEHTKVCPGVRAAALQIGGSLRYKSSGGSSERPK